VAPGAHRLRKCISLAGAITTLDPSPNDYRLFGNREYVRDLSGTRWVKLYVSWFHLQEELQPASRAESWGHLETAPAGKSFLRVLDRQIRAVNDDARRAPGGMGVLLTVYQSFPTWAGAARDTDPGRDGRDLATKLPNDLTTEGPWAWFLEHLIVRYRRGGPRNPDGAYVDALEICNEPNLLFWPQQELELRLAAMIRTATALAERHGGPHIVAPGTSDSDSGRATDWRSFTDRLLGELARGPRPSAQFAWSHHNYLDVRDELSAEETRVREVIELLDRAGWPGGDRRLWLTEAGVNMYPDHERPATRELQARRIERNFLEMAKLPEVFMWTQHVINDVPTNTFKSGLRDDFRGAFGPGAKRPAWAAWASLPGSEMA
jgi:hypothetical protein